MSSLRKKWRINGNRTIEPLNTVDIYFTTPSTIYLKIYILLSLSILKFLFYATYNCLLTNEYYCSVDSDRKTVKLRNVYTCSGCNNFSDASY